MSVKTSVVTEEAIDEDDNNTNNDNNAVSLVVNSTNTRRTAIVPLLTLREKKVSSTELLGKSIERATAIAADARLVPKR